VVFSVVLFFRYTRRNTFTTFLYQQTCSLAGSAIHALVLTCSRAKFEIPRDTYSVCDLLTIETTDWGRR